MITKADIILLLSDMKENGIDVKADISEVIRSQTVPVEIIKKVNDYKPLDVVNFYEKLRKSYNAKHSKLYLNIMHSDEHLLKDPKIALTTLSALLNQILQFKCEDRVMFYQHSRADEIVKVLQIYFESYNIEPAIKLLSLTKADIKCLESFKEI